MAEDDEHPAERARPGVKPSGKPTLKTIAQMTGLAITTISRALNNAPELAQETRDRVQRVAAEVGYLPDRTALRLKTGRTNVIALVLEPDEQIYGFGSSVVAGLTEAMRNTAYHLVIMPQFRNVQPIEPIRHIVRNRMADGVIFSHTEPFDERVRFLLDNNFPFISHGRTEWPDPHPYVDFDNEVFAYGSVKRLAQLGCKNVSIVLPSSAYTYSQHMRAGFERAVAETGIAGEIASDVTLSSPAYAIREYVLKRCRRPKAPDGFVCSDEMSALAIIAGFSDNGLTIGKDYHVVCKQSSPLFPQFQPQVETVYEDFNDSGLRLGKLMLGLIAGADIASSQHVVVPDIHFDGSRPKA